MDLLTGREVILTGSIGLAMMEPRAAVTCEDLVRNAEVAMFHAKRIGGGDHIEVFKPTMRTALADQPMRRPLESMHLPQGE